MDEKTWRALAKAMRREVGRHFPEWTGGTSHDPGVTLVELFAFLTENLLVRPTGARPRRAIPPDSSRAPPRKDRFATATSPASSSMSTISRPNRTTSAGSLAVITGSSMASGSPAA